MIPAKGAAGLSTIPAWNLLTKATGTGSVVRIRAKYLPQPALQLRFARSSAWIVAASLVSQGLGLVTLIIVARFLGEESFGRFAFIQSTLAVFGVFAGMGLGLTATKYVAEFKVIDPERAGLVIGFSSVFGVAMGAATSLVLYAAAPLLLRLMTDAVDLTTELRMSSALVLLNSINGVQSGVLAGFENFRDIARVNVLRGVCCMAITIPAVAFWNLRGALFALIISSAVALVLNHSAIREQCRIREVPVAYARRPSATSSLWGFSVPAFLSSAMTIPVTWISNAMLIRSSGGYAEMGIYNAANQMRTAATYIPGLLGQAALPILSSLYGSRDRDNYRRLLFMNLLFVVGIVAVIAVPACFASPWIMGAFGSGFRAAWPVLVVLMISAVLSCPCGVVGQALASSGRMWPGFYLNCVWAVVLLGAAKWTVGRFGSLGLGSAMLAAYAVHSLTSLWYARSRMALEHDRRYSEPSV